MRMFLFAAAVSALALPQVAQAQRPAALNRLTDCRAITDSAERLACFDREVAAIDAAEARKDLIVVDREQVKKARRSLFGLPLPNLGVFGDDSSDQANATIEASIKRAWQAPDGKWRFELEDGARWAQIDSRNLSSDAKSGQPIKIRRAALGSYLANVNNQVAVRVRRIR